MADISITAANVIAGANAIVKHGSAGATITAGQVLYRDPADGTYKLADNNSATAAVRSPKGIALNGASAGQPLAVLTEGDITIGGTLTAGVAYYLSDTPGGICPVADLASGEYPSLIGIAESTTVLSVKFQESGVAL
ncbi:MAG: hypothetical protein AB7O91_04085 [Sphingomonas sp.]